MKQQPIKLFKFVLNDDGQPSVTIRIIHRQYPEAFTIAKVMAHILLYKDILSFGWINLNQITENVYDKD